jgi:hypothetical protein
MTFVKIYRSHLQGSSPRSLNIGHNILPRNVDFELESSWNVMAHGDAREGKWRGNWRMEWVSSTLHTNSEHGVSTITTADAHTSAPNSRLNWLPCRFNWTRPFRRETKFGFCACAITFQTQSNSPNHSCPSGLGLKKVARQSVMQSSLLTCKQIQTSGEFSRCKCWTFSEIAISKYLWKTKIQVSAA